VPHQQAEGIKASALRKRVQRADSRIVIHTSSIADITV
jgi:hypothetical protein